MAEEVKTTVSATESAAEAEYLFHLDAVPDRVSFSRRIEISGWLFHRQGKADPWSPRNGESGAAQRARSQSPAQTRSTRHRSGLSQLAGGGDERVSARDRRLPVRALHARTASEGSREELANDLHDSDHGFPARLHRPAPAAQRAARAGRAAARPFCGRTSSSQERSRRTGRDQGASRRCSDNRSAGSDHNDPSFCDFQVEPVHHRNCATGLCRISRGRVHC